LDGVRLDHFVAGTVREVSPSIGSWLIAQGYAIPEMRGSYSADLDDDPSGQFDLNRDRRRRR
jgi:hypothetical protein